MGQVVFDKAEEGDRQLLDAIRKGFRTISDRLSGETHSNQQRKSAPQEEAGHASGNRTDPLVGSIVGGGFVGFGLGFERLIQFVTGMTNIREAIAFPRTPGFAPC